MNKHLEQVEDFHDTFNIPIEDSPIVPIKERCDLRIRLLEEEVAELKKAFEDNDLVGVADALADIAYVLNGTAHETGMAHIFGDLQDEVHRSNMTKVAKDGTINIREDGKVLKPDTFEHPKLKEIVEGGLPF